MLNKLVKGFVVGVALIGSLTMVGCESTESVLEEDPIAIEEKLAQEAYDLGAADAEWYRKNISENEILDDQILSLVEERHYKNEIPADENTEYVGDYILGLLTTLNPDTTDDDVERIMDMFIASIKEMEEFENSFTLTEDQAVEKMKAIVNERFGILNAGLFRIKYDFVNNGKTAVGIVESVQTGRNVMKITIDMKTGEFVTKEM